MSAHGLARALDVTHDDGIHDVPVLVDRRSHPTRDHMKCGHPKGAQALPEGSCDLADAVIVRPGIDKLVKLLVERGELRGIVAARRVVASGVASAQLLPLHLGHPLRAQSRAKALEFAEGFEHVAQALPVDPRHGHAAAGARFRKTGTHELS